MSISRNHVSFSRYNILPCRQHDKVYIFCIIHYRKFDLIVRAIGSYDLESGTYVLHH